MTFPLWFQTEVQLGFLGLTVPENPRCFPVLQKKYSAGSKVRFGYVPQENPLFDELKPIDNLRMWTNKKKPEILSLLTTPPLCKLGIQNFLDTPVKNMSGGMKKRLSLACALLEHPQILLMDEPFAALDLPAKQDALQFMQYYLGLGNSILIASHEEAVFQFCSHVYLLQNGTLTNTSALPEGTSYIDLLRR